MPLFNPPTLFYDPLLIQSSSVDVANVTALNIIDGRIILSQSGPYVVDISLSGAFGSPQTFTNVAISNNNTLTNTTNFAFQTHLTITASHPAPGQYALLWHTDCFTSQANKGIMLDVVDESGVVQSVFQQTVAQPNQAVPFSGMRGVVLATTASKSYSLRYKVLTATTLSVVSSSLAFWKIS